MNLIIITLIAVSTLSTFPVRTLGDSSATVPVSDVSTKPASISSTASTTHMEMQFNESETIEEPKILPVKEASKHTDNKNDNVEEIWQETEREVLIRSERGAKDQNGGTTSGKKGKNSKEKQNRNKLQEQQKQAHQQLQQQQEQKSQMTNSNSNPKNPKNNTQSHQKHQKQNKTDKNNTKNSTRKNVDESKFFSASQNFFFLSPRFLVQ